MSKAFGIGFLAAVLVIVVLLWTGAIKTEGNHLEPAGFISNVRVQSVAPEETLMVIDFSLINDAKIPMTAGIIDPWITTAQGEKLHGSLFAGADMEKTFTYYPALGPMVHPPLHLHATIEPHTHPSLMVGVEFDYPVQVIESRKSVTLHIEATNGPFVEMTAK